MHSPRHQERSTTTWQTRTSIVSTSHYSSLTSTLLSPRQSMAASPRTLVSSSQTHGDPQYGQVDPSSMLSMDDVLDDDSAATATPPTPTSKTVHALFGSLRPSRHPTPQMARTSLPTIAPLSDLRARTPPPLPPQSTRPEPQVHRGNLSQSRIDLLKSMNAELRPSSSNGLRSPSRSQGSTLQSFGLDNTPRSPQPTTRIIGTPYQAQRTLMSDSEVSVTTVSVRSTVVSIPPHSSVLLSAPRAEPTNRLSHQRRSTLPAGIGGSAQPPVPELRTKTPPAHGGGIFNIFRPKSPGPRPFPVTEPQPKSPVPPRTSSPLRTIFPFNLRYKPKKSISGASVEAVIDGKIGGLDAAQSSELSLVPGEMPSPPMRDPVEAVDAWRRHEQESWIQSGKARRTRPGVSFDLPPGSKDDASKLKQLNYVSDAEFGAN